MELPEGSIARTRTFREYDWTGVFTGASRGEGRHDTHRIDRVASPPHETVPLKAKKHGYQRNSSSQFPLRHETCVSPRRHDFHHSGNVEQALVIGYEEKSFGKVDAHPIVDRKMKIPVCAEHREYDADSLACVAFAERVHAFPVHEEDANGQYEFQKQEGRENGEDYDEVEHLVTVADAYTTK
jgi:hypothetical protein